MALRCGNAQKRHCDAGLDECGADSVEVLCDIEGPRTVSLTSMKN